MYIWIQLHLPLHYIIATSIAPVYNMHKAPTADQCTKIKPQSGQKVRNAIQCSRAGVGDVHSEYLFLTLNHYVLCTFLMLLKTLNKVEFEPLAKNRNNLAEL